MSTEDVLDAYEARKAELDQAAMLLAPKGVPETDTKEDFANTLKRVGAKRKRMHQEQQHRKLREQFVVFARSHITALERLVDKLLMQGTMKEQDRARRALEHAHQACMTEVEDPELEPPAPKRTRPSADSALTLESMRLEYDISTDSAATPNDPAPLKVVKLLPPPPAPMILIDDDNPDIEQQQAPTAAAAASESDSYYYCNRPQCKCFMELDTANNMYICPRCSRTTEAHEKDTRSAANNGGSGDVHTAPQRPPNESRVPHWITLLRQIESCELLPEENYTRIKEYIANHFHLPYDEAVRNISIKSVREALERCGLKHVSRKEGPTLSMYRHLRSLHPFKFTKEQRQKLVDMFLRIQEPLRHYKGSTGNAHRPSTTMYFWAREFLQELGWRDVLAYVPVINATPRSVTRHEKIAQWVKSQLVPPQFDPSPTNKQQQQQ